MRSSAILCLTFFATFVAYGTARGQVSNDPCLTSIEEQHWNPNWLDQLFLALRTAVAGEKPEYTKLTKDIQRIQTRKMALADKLESVANHTSGPSGVPFGQRQWQDISLNEVPSLAKELAAIVKWLELEADGGGDLATRPVYVTLLRILDSRRIESLPDVCKAVRLQLPLIGAERTQVLELADRIRRQAQELAVANGHVQCFVRIKIDGEDPEECQATAEKLASIPESGATKQEPN